MEYRDPLVEPFMQRLKEAAPDLTEQQLKDIRRVASAPAGSQDCPEEPTGPKRRPSKQTKTPGR
jgi:hypothetical protein